MTKGLGFFKSFIVAVCIIIGIASSAMIYICLDRGNWIGGFMVFPALCYLSLDKVYSMMKDVP